MMPDIIDGTKVTQIGEGPKTGLNVRDRLFVNGQEVLSTQMAPRILLEGVFFGPYAVAYKDDLTGNLMLAQADNFATSNVIGVTFPAPNGTYLYFDSGYIDVSEFPPGVDSGFFFLDAAVAGAVTQTPPAFPNYVVPLAQVIDENTIFLAIGAPFPGAP